MAASAPTGSCACPSRLASTARRADGRLKPGRPERPPWVHLMAMRKRKTLVVCERCHQDNHAGRSTAPVRK
ncbi:hypothetical protein [Streptomyces avermitilis]|uniref:HNH endonuclease n=1 Tax=Streptomyces avermitilis TaxID=33903 RepID=UPI0037F1179C